MTDTTTCYCHTKCRIKPQKTQTEREQKNKKGSNAIQKHHTRDNNMININYEQLDKFMTKYYKKKMVDTTPTIEIDYQLFQQNCHNITKHLETNYHTVIKQLERHITQTRIQKPETRIKLKNVRPLIKINKIHQKYNNKWISFEGTVKKRSKVYNQIHQAHWTCKNCAQDTIHKQKLDEALSAPKSPCRYCSRRMGYTLNKKKSKYTDIQQIIIEEQDTITHQPTQIKCLLKDELINQVNPGDKIRANGILELKNNKKQNIFQEYVDITNIEKQEQKFEEIKLTKKEIKQITKLAKNDNIYRKIIKSTMPSLYGHNELKLALTLQLFSSPQHTTHDGTYKRGDIHILLIGDPSVGKSQILKYITKIAPNGIYTSGKSTSGAGLTATAVKDELGGWSLEAGAMVLANQGNICIDEFDKMNEEDRSTIHEALEQQTISISKAGINTTLKSKCSVLAAANPKYGRFNPYKNLSEQLNLSPPILSRFDLIFIITDRINREEDTKIAIKILEEETETPDEDLIDEKMLKKYISHARKINPKLTPEVNEHIAEFFSQWRQIAKQNNNPIPITARQLEAIARLSKASARIKLKDKVTIEDAERAIKLQKYCMKHAGFDITTLTADADKIMGNITHQERTELDKITDEFKTLTNKTNTITEELLIKHLQLMGHNIKSIKKWINENNNNTIIYNKTKQTFTKI